LRVGHDWLSPTLPMFRRYFLVGFLFLLAGCATPPQIAPLTEPAAVAQEIAAEPVGDFYIGRRIYCPPFALWGYVRSPRQSWRTAKLVILNENTNLRRIVRVTRSVPTAKASIGFTVISPETGFMTPPVAGFVRSSF